MEVASGHPIQHRLPKAMNAMQDWEGRRLATWQGSARFPLDSPDRPDDQVVVWDAASGEKVRAFIFRDDVRFAVLDPSGKKMATAGTNGVARVWEVADGTSISLKHDKPVD